MQLNPTQKLTLKNAILAEPAVAAFVAAGDDGSIASYYNQPSTFIVYRDSVQTSEIGKAVMYAAIGAMTTANATRVQLFHQMNPESFKATADIEAFFADTFGGALAGAGQASRDALVALWRRAATRAEALFATGTGTTNSPGDLVVEGTLTPGDVGSALRG